MTRRAGHLQAGIASCGAVFALASNLRPARILTPGSTEWRPPATSGTQGLGARVLDRTPPMGPA